MPIKKKIVSLSTGVLLLLILSKSILEFPYRNKIPDLPDQKNITESLSNQITTASRKAHINPTAYNLGILGMIYHSSAYYDKAAECYRLAIKRNSSKWIWSYYLGYLNKEMGESENAIRNFENVVKNNPGANHAWYYIGEGYLDIEQHQLAEGALRKITSLNEIISPANKIFRTDHFPIGTYASFLLAKSYLNTDQLESSEDILTELINTSKTFGPAYRVLGNLYQIKGDSVSARKYIDQANDLMSVTAPADTLIDMIALRSRSELFILKQIDEASNTYYTDWALTLANHALNYLPDDKYLISKTIKLQLRGNSDVNTNSFLNDHLRSFTNDFEELKQVADLLYERRLYSQSRDYYNRALELVPGNTEIKANLVFGLLNEDKKEEALALLDRYLMKESNNPDIIANAVYTMLLIDDNKKAEYYLSKLRELSPEGLKTLLFTGFVAQQNGDLNKARELLERAYKENPQDLLSAQALGDLLIRQKMWGRSIELFRKALEYFPNEPFIIEKLGSLLATCPDSSLRNFNEGKIYLERLLIHKACPAEIKISAGKNLARGYSLVGNKQEALSYANYTLLFARNYDAPKEVFDQLQALIKELKD